MLDALTMSDGRSIPAQGFGVFQIPAEQTADAVAQAIEVATAISIQHSLTSTRRP